MLRRSTAAVASSSCSGLPRLIKVAPTTTLRRPRIVPPPPPLTSSSSCLSRTASSVASSSSAPPPLLSRYSHFDPKPALDSTGQIPIGPYDIAPLACSAPSYPKGHLIVHPYTQARPQETWPPAIESVCPFIVDLAARTKAQLAGWGIAFSDGDPKLTTSRPDVFPVWDVSTPKTARPVPGDAAEEEEFLIQIYEGNGKHAVVGPFSVRTLPEDLTPVIERALARAPIPSAKYPKKAEESHVYICTHGSRDCRCGVVGEQLKETMREEVRKHEVRVLGEGSKKIHIYGVSHVGGHKWAANALVYPHGDWYGNLRLSDAPLLLRSALAPSTSRHDLTDQRERLVHWPRWRGRLGLTEEKMKKVWDEWGGGLVETAVITPIVRRRASAKQQEPTSASLAAVTPAPVVEVVSVPFRRHSGEVVYVEAKLGENVKDVAKRAGIEEIEATCGGKCECATCHAYIAAAQVGSSTHQEASDLSLLPPESALAPASDEESDMLDYAITRKPTSRLTCQVTVTAELAEWFKQGGRIQLSRY